MCNWNSLGNITTIYFEDFKRKYILRKKIKIINNEKGLLSLGENKYFTFVIKEIRIYNIRNETVATSCRLCLLAGLFYSTTNNCYIIKKNHITRMTPNYFYFK